MKYSKGIFSLLVLFLGLMISCDPDAGNSGADNAPFDRRAMLEHWAQNTIIPDIISYKNLLEDLDGDKDLFIENPNAGTYNQLTNSWIEAYKAWQYVSMFDIGKAESIGLRNYTNIYPTDITLVEDNINSGEYNLELPSNFDAQGFPALDYLLFGLGENQEERINALSDQRYATYLDDLVTRLLALTQEVENDWTGGYQDEFVDNNGSSATASVDKIVNDYLFYYEKFLRAGKIGIPAGKFSGSPLSDKVEAPYAGIYSKVLLKEGFTAVQNFFNGRGNNGVTSGPSLKQYLEHVQRQNGTADIATDILTQWVDASEKIEALNDNLRLQVEQDNDRMLEAFDALQLAVPLLKVDMMQALNIQVDFVDADGD